MNDKDFFMHLASDVYDSIHSALLVGSFAEGLNTSTSDYDYFLIVDDLEKKKISQKLIRTFSGRLVEYTLFSLEECQNFIRKVKSKTYLNYSVRELELMHKFFKGKVVHGESFFYKLVKDFHEPHFREKLISYYLDFSLDQYEDSIGAFKDGDFLSAISFVRLMIDGAIDAWLVNHGDSYPKPKWRVKRAMRSMEGRPTLFNKYKKLIFPDILETIENYQNQIMEGLSLYRTLTSEIYIGTVIAEPPSKAEDSKKLKISAWVFLFKKGNQFIVCNGTKYYSIDIMSAYCIMLLEHPMSITQLSEVLPRLLVREHVDSHSFNKLNRCVEHLQKLGLLSDVISITDAHP